MNNIKKYKYLLKDLSSVKGVGTKTSEILKKKNINTVFDLLYRLPTSYVDRSIVSKVNELKVGKISTLNLFVKKYLFPRVRNLPNKVICEDETGIIECIFFNSREGYIRKILPLNKQVTVSGKISYFKKKYQITNPNYVSENREQIEKVHTKYRLTEGINEKQYNNIIKEVILNLPEIPEWHDEKIIEKFNYFSWRKSIIQLHNPKNIGNYQSDYYKRLAFDEIFSSMLISSEIRKKIKKLKKEKKFLMKVIQKKF